MADQKDLGVNYLGFLIQKMVKSAVCNVQG